MTCPWLHWTTDNLSGMHMVSISTPVCVNFELRPGAGDIHIWWFNFDALAQGNAYKPTKEPINIVDQAGIELTTSRLRQLRQLPVVQHVRFTPLKSRQKTQLQWRARGCTGQLTTCLECTWCQFQHLCVLILNCALALAIYIFGGLILMLWHRETHINPQRNR